jgi:hypothetical protein
MPDATDHSEGHHPSSPGGSAGDGQAVNGAGKSPPAKPSAPSGPTAVQLALEAGWTMAVLHGKIQSIPPDKLLGLPTANELQEADRRQLELDRLRHLLKSLSQMPDFSESGLSDRVLPNFDALSEDLTKLNLGILCALAAAQSQALFAYELGRSLRDTANPPDERPAGKDPAASALSRPFARGRIATLQGWLAALSGELPPRSAAVVAASLGRWSEFVAITTGTPTAQLKNDEDAKVAAATAEPATPPGKNDAEKVAAATARYLLRQGDLWLMLLTGTRTTSGLLSPEGYVAAGELALRRSAAIIRRVLQHYWAALLIGAIALGVVLYLAASNLGGAAKVWTTIAAIAGSLGITARAIASTTARLAAEAERPVFAIAEEDAMAWAITTMPPLRLRLARVRQLRKAGIAPTSSLGRV